MRSYQWRFKGKESVSPIFDLIHQVEAAFKELLKQRDFTQYKLERVTGLDKGLISRL